MIARGSGGNCVVGESVRRVVCCLLSIECFMRLTLRVCVLNREYKLLVFSVLTDYDKSRFFQCFS